MKTQVKIHTTRIHKNNYPNSNINNFEGQVIDISVTKKPGDNPRFSGSLTLPTYKLKPLTQHYQDCQAGFDTNLLPAS